MDSRRDFLKKAALLAAGSGLAGVFPAIQRAFAIDPAPGTTFLDAEHVVILMQENRSFDHMYGMLRGVRGFNDPRAVNLPDGNPVWLQTNQSGATYAPFRLNIKDTKSTWMGSLPHSRESQLAASNNGKHDRWLDAKHSDEKEYLHLPLTMGYYNRDDIPFYYALADAFTICDQNFCSSLTATEPNRVHLWTGGVRADQSIESFAYVRNDDMGYEKNLQMNWKTFPERLEERGISWRIYQNEIALPTGFEAEAAAWLSNFDDNPIEYFSQYHVKFSRAHRRFLAQRDKLLASEIAESEAKTSRTDTEEKKLTDKRAELEQVRKDLATWTQEAFARLPSAHQNIHRKAFTTNEAHPDYRELSKFIYRDGQEEHQMHVPKGDVLYQFREDARSGNLPTVSWIVPPEKFSDHPCSPWYGAWYLSETLDILTQNPGVWKKTIFILCYDENDGYFDHVPPYVPPHWNHPGTGKVSAGIDTSGEFVSEKQEEEIRRREHEEGRGGLAGPIGLGFRVPLVIASPWSRGGYVCSHVFDHTSILRLLEKVLSHKTGQALQESNISAWRRTVCGDLTTVFRPYNGEKIELPLAVEREPFLGIISRAQFRPVPDNYKKLSPAEITRAREQSGSVPWLPRQEKGNRRACALPYELEATGMLSADKKSFAVRLSAGNKFFGLLASGAPFRIFAPGKSNMGNGHFDTGRVWNYAVKSGDSLADEFVVADFEQGMYHLQIHGPNGFFRGFRGTAEDPLFEVRLEPAGNTEAVVLKLVSHDSRRAMVVMVDDAAYGGSPRSITLVASGKQDAALNLDGSHGWYDLRIRVQGSPDFEQRHAGHIETGRDSFSDPAMA
jgi:phospholipase C